MGAKAPYPTGNIRGGITKRLGSLDPSRASSSSRTRVTRRSPPEGPMAGRSRAVLLAGGLVVGTAWATWLFTRTPPRDDADGRAPGDGSAAPAGPSTTSPAGSPETG